MKIAVTLQLLVAGLACAAVHLFRHCMSMAVSRLVHRKSIARFDLARVEKDDAVSAMHQARKEVLFQQKRLFVNKKIADSAAIILYPICRPRQQTLDILEARIGVEPT